MKTKQRSLIDVLIVKKMSFFILFATSIIFNCCKDDNIPDYKEITYNLSVSPSSYEFSAEGGELEFNVKAVKTTKISSKGTGTVEKITDIPFSITISEDFINVVDSKIIVKENRNEMRTGDIIVSLMENDLKRTINITQLGVVDSIENSRSTLKVLAIGNSFSVDAVEQYLYDITKSQGDSILIGNLYLGSAYLHTHFYNAQVDSGAYQYRKIVDGKKTNRTNTSISYALKDETWDIVTLQQASPSSGLPNTYNPYFDYLIMYVREQVDNSDLKIGFHMTWAWQEGYAHSGYANYNRNQLTMYNAIVNTMKEFVYPKVDLIIPTGTAIQNGRTSLLGDTYNRDGNHLDYIYGRYTAALTWYQKLYSKSAIDVLFYPVEATPFQVKVAQHAAYYAVENPYEITSLSHLEKEKEPNMIPDIIGSVW